MLLVSKHFNNFNRYFLKFRTVTFKVLKPDTVLILQHNALQA